MPSRSGSGVSTHVSSSAIAPTCGPAEWPSPTTAGCWIPATGAGLHLGASIAGPDRDDLAARLPDSHRHSLSRQPLDLAGLAGDDEAARPLAEQPRLSGAAALLHQRLEVGAQPHLAGDRAL